MARRAKRPPRDYEGELVQGLEDVGFTVITWPAWVKRPLVPAPPKLAVTQFRIQVRKLRNGRMVTYRADIAIPAVKLVIEYDGFGYGPRTGHVSFTGWHRDRERDRNMLMTGWTVVRFGPGHMRDAAATALCISEIVAVYDMLIYEQGGDVSRETIEADA